MKKHISKYILSTSVIIGVLTFIISFSGMGKGNDVPIHAAGGDSTGGEENADAVSGISETAKAVDELIYGIGSVSKVYVTAAVMQLAEEGKVDIDAPVTQYLPDFKMADERYKNITVRMLMNHTSGLMGTTQIGCFLYNDADTYRHDHLLELLSTQRLKADPGEYAAYCNDGFDVLELLVERVSGMDYTDYIQEKIAGKTGGSSTGSPRTVLSDSRLVPGYTGTNLRFTNVSVMCLGAGGMYATASDVANFGTAFFNGNDSLLSENSKAEMAKRTMDDEYADKNGLGWDFVNKAKYEEAGVQVLGKGGDVVMNHAFLAVAPEEKISISVLTNGGSSSFNEALALELMDLVLEEKGIDIKENEPVENDIVSAIPESYDEYEGTYSTSGNNGGALVCNIAMVDHKYMHVTYISPFGEDESDFMLTTDGNFTELAYLLEEGKTEGAHIANNPIKIKFTKWDNGKIYFSVETQKNVPGVGKTEYKIYAGEKLEANPVSEEVKASWKKISGKPFMLYNDIYSAVWYDTPTITVYTSDMFDGYVFFDIGGNIRLQKIIDEIHAVAFQTIPSSINRDISDVELVRDENGLSLNVGNGTDYRLADDMPVLDNSIKTVELKDRNARWFRIGDEMAGSSMIVERPENSMICVFNRYAEEIYTTHVTDAVKDIPLPMDGFIVFAGKTGDTVEIK